MLFRNLKTLVKEHFRKQLQAYFRICQLVLIAFRTILAHEVRGYILLKKKKKTTTVFNQN